MKTNPFPLLILRDSIRRGRITIRFLRHIAMLVLQETIPTGILQQDFRFSRHFTILKEAVVAIVAADTAPLLRVSSGK
jgi:hypothetical protein